MREGLIPFIPESQAPVVKFKSDIKFGNAQADMTATGLDVPTTPPLKLARAYNPKELRSLLGDIASITRGAIAGRTETGRPIACNEAPAVLQRPSRLATSMRMNSGKYEGVQFLETCSSLYSPSFSPSFTHRARNCGS